MGEQPNEQLLRSEVKPVLKENIETVSTILQMPQNKDAIVRDFIVGGIGACLIFIDGMAGGSFIDSGILHPCRLFAGKIEGDAKDRAEYLARNVIDLPDIMMENRISSLITAILNGQTVVMIEGCAEALICETRFYERRTVSRTNTESVVMGSQEGFVENMRTNITLIRRIVRSPMLVTEMMTVGTQLPTNLSILYLKGAANEQVLDEVRRRIKGIDVSFLPDCGHLQQLIEDRPYMLLPQTLMTERPDRTCYLLGEGRIAIIMDNSPYALVAPISFFDLMQTADDSFKRWQYGAMSRLVRYLGMLISVLLPGLYVALTLYHTQMIPMDLLSSIAETRAKVPFPVILELLIMEFAFYLINEAGTRMPTQIGPALGIVGALILGQAAVAANIISPILIIIVALTGLGNYSVPDYGLGIALEIMRLGLMFAGAFLGLVGVSMMLFLYLCVLCSMRSFGEPYMAPVAPWRPHNMDAIIRLPEWVRNRLPYFVNESSWLKRSPNGSNMRIWEGKKK